MAHPTAQSQTRFARLGNLKLGLQLSRKCLGVGVLLLAMEAPVLAQLAEAIDPSAAETDLIEALTSAPALAPLMESAQVNSAQANIETINLETINLETAPLGIQPLDTVTEPLSANTEEVTQEALETLADTMADAVLENEVPIEEDAVVNRGEQDGSLADAVDDAPSPATKTETIVEVEASPAEQAAEDVELTESAPVIVPAEPEGELATEEELVKEDELVTEAETENSDGAIAEDSPEGDLAEGEETSEDKLAEGETLEEAPIPTLAERCAAPEATLFPPEPEEADATETETNSEAASENPAEPETGDATSVSEGSEAASGDESATGPEEAAEEEAAEKETAEEVAIVEPDTDLDDLDKEAKAEAAAKAAEEKELVCALYQADQQYQAGQIAEAKAGYQLAKDPFAAEAKAVGLRQKPAITDPAELSPGGRVFLREAAAGREQNLPTRILVPLELLTQQHPEFIPGQIQLAEALVDANRAEEALTLLEEATGRYPNEPSLLRAHIDLAGQQGEWMDAVMQARRFAQLNPDHPEAEAFVALAEENMVSYQREVRDRLRANTIANVLTGAVSVALTGSIWNSLSSIQTTAMMLRGEEGVGNGISKSIKRQVELVEDEEVLNYVQAMGEELVAVAGRDEFEYEFNLLMDPNLNAFALPGGKIFVNAGAIAKTRSKAELAGLLSHELAHAVLSHGFRLVSDGSLLSDLSRFVPYGGYASNLVVLNYSREMEREADELGARILASAGYAADGLHGLMKTLGEQNSRKPLFAWMSTHPETDERVGNLEEQISKEGLDRYQFEGVEEHFRMRVKVMRLIEEWKERKAKEEEERPWWR